MPNHGTVVYPDPVKLNWDPVNGAQKYGVALSTSSDLSSEVPGFPITTSATVVTPPARLLPGSSTGGRSRRSTPRATRASRLSPGLHLELAVRSDDAVGVRNPTRCIGVEDPVFSWTPVPGAVGYQIQINPTTDFSSGNICCDGTVINATSYSPTTLLTFGQLLLASAGAGRERQLRRLGDGDLGGYRSRSNPPTAPSSTSPTTGVLPDHYDQGGITNLTMARRHRRRRVDARVLDRHSDRDVGGRRPGRPPTRSTWPCSTARSACTRRATTGHTSPRSLRRPSWTPLGSGRINNLLVAGHSYCVQVTAQRHEDGRQPVVYGRHHPARSESQSGVRLLRAIPPAARAPRRATRPQHWRRRLRAASGQPATPEPAAVHVEADLGQGQLLRGRRHRHQLPDDHRHRVHPRAGLRAAEQRSRC